MMEAGSLVIADRSGPTPAAGLVEPPLRKGAKERPRRIVVIGEFNSGKTTLVNALIGTAVLPTSFTRHTAYRTVVGFAARPALRAELVDRRRVAVPWSAIDETPAPHIARLHVGMPLDRLKALRAVDTPGFGLGDEADEVRTMRACRGADTVIWCTPAMQAWKASELRTWLALPRATRRRGILAVTFMDALPSPGDAGRLLMRLTADAGPHFRRIVTFSSQGFCAAPAGELA
jgi:GTPase Era involved in 16S rRNA processing